MRIAAISALVVTGAVLVFRLSGCMSLERDPHELTLGASVPTVTVQQPTGEVVELGSLAGDGSLVLVSYRGRW